MPPQEKPKSTPEQSKEQVPSFVKRAEEVRKFLGIEDAEGWQERVIEKVNAPLSVPETSKAKLARPELERRFRLLSDDQLQVKRTLLGAVSLIDIKVKFIIIKPFG